MNILIVNQPSNNRGDEAAHKSLMRSLNKQLPNARITVLFQFISQDSIEQMEVRSPQNTYINSNPTNKFINTVRKWALRLNLMKLSLLHTANNDIAKHIKNTDLVFCAPGGICMGLFQNWSHIYILSLAKKYKKEIAYYSRSFGPFPTATKWNRVFKKVSYKLLSYFSFISIRDSKTMALADEMNIAYTKSIDSAFLDTPQVKLPIEIETLLNDKEYVVFVPNQLTWHEAFKNCSKQYIEDFYIKLARMLLTKYENTNIIMLPQIFNVGNLGDMHYFQNLNKIINNKRIIVINEKYSSDIQQTIISGAKLMVGARYHSVVFAINNEVPFVALSYEHKISGLLEILNLSENKFDLEQFGKQQPDIDKTILEIETIIDNAKPEAKAQKIAQKIAQKCMKEFLEMVN